MKKLSILFLALALCFSFGQVVLADVQIDAGQRKSDAPVKFMIVRLADSSTFPVGVSKDSVVVWDSTSKDGVTIKLSTTSGDLLAAGIMMDSITGITSDNTAAEDMGSPVWGRMQTWGLYENATILTNCQATTGSRLITSATAGALSDNNANIDDQLSSDGMMVGVALESPSSGTVDMMVKID